jgi:ATP-dependent Clp protease ATP-binding subunit ClpB
MLIQEGYDPHYGARPMRRAIQRLIQDPLALKLLNGEFQDGDTIEVDAQSGSNELRFQKLVPVAA